MMPPDPPYVRAWLCAFIVTLAIETPLLARLARRSEPSTRRRLAFVLVANLASHPLVWFVFPVLPLAWAVTTAISESWAWLLEAAIYRLAFARATAGSALALSLAANALSFVVGLVLSALGILQ